MQWRRHKSGFYAHMYVFPVVLGLLWKDLQNTLAYLSILKDLKMSGQYVKLDLTVNVHMGLWTVQVALLSHDNVLNVFHSKVVTESIIKQSLKLIHSQFLHVTLGRHKTPRQV